MVPSIPITPVIIPECNPYPSVEIVNVHIGKIAINNCLHRICIYIFGGGYIVFHRNTSQRHYCIFWLLFSFLLCTL